MIYKILKKHVSKIFLIYLTSFFPQTNIVNRKYKIFVIRSSWHCTFQNPCYHFLASIIYFYYYYFLFFQSERSGWSFLTNFFKPSTFILQGNYQLIFFGFKLAISLYRSCTTRKGSTVIVHVFTENFHFWIPANEKVCFYKIGVYVSTVIYKIIQIKRRLTCQLRI